MQRATASAKEAASPVLVQVRSSLSSVRSGLLQRKSAALGKPNLTSESDDERKKREESNQGTLQRQAAGPSHPTAVPPIVHEVLRSPGQPLDATTRASMESRFGHDFSGVRVHDDGLAAASARAVDAHAYTVGNDIVFNTGRYDTNTSTGQRLLAHELAHTVQQRDLQRSASGVSMPLGPEDQRLEQEAERAAVSPFPGKMPPLKRAATPFLSRARSATQDPAAEPDDSDKDNVQEYGPLNNTYGTSVYVRRLTNKLVPGRSPTVKGAHWELLNLRSTPSKAGDYYVRGHLLNDNLGGPGNDWKNLTPLTSVANNKSSESHLHAFEKHVKDAVLNKGQTVEFSVAAEYGRGARSLDETKLPDMPADEKKTIKEIVAEEQYIPKKLICTAKDANTNQPVEKKSTKGGDPGKIGEVVEIANDIDESPQSYFLNTKKYAEYKKSAVAPSSGGGAPKVAVAGEAYELKVGGQPITINAKVGFGITDLAGQAAANVAKGLVLKTLHRTKKGDFIDAMIVTDPGGKGGGKSGVPLEIKEKDNIIKLKVVKGALLHEAQKPILIAYKPLSPGVIKSVSYDDKTGFSAKGVIKPSVPLLKGSEIGIEISGDQLSAKAEIPKDKLKGLPGMRITEASVGIDLSPEFKPSGSIAFQIGPEGNPVANGSIKVFADAQGFAAEGDLIAHIPGLDEAKGKVTYRRDAGWEGGFDVTKSGKSFIENASVHVGFSDREGLDLRGGLGIKLPGDQKITVTIQKKKDGWVFIGSGNFKAPGGLLEPVLLHFTYDGEHLEATGESGVKFHGLNGHLKVKYVDGKVSGEGTLTVDKGRASGRIHLKMSPEQKFSAEGEVTIKITDNLTATGGIKIDENEKVTLKGELKFPKPIELFKPFEGERQIFSVGVSIPIPGVSIGPVGVKARIEGALSAGYRIGPGELRDLKVTATGNPLEEKPDLDLQMHGQLYISAGAHISGSITGAIVLDAVIASASGGLTVTATAILDGHVASQVDLHYAKGRFEAKADFELMLSLALKLALDAFVQAQAGIGPFKVETRKDWNLAAYTYDTGLKLGMKTKSPLLYASDQPFQPPSLDQIEITKPQIDVSDALRKVFQGAGGTERAK